MARSDECRAACEQGKKSQMRAAGSRATPGRTLAVGGRSSSPVDRILIRTLLRDAVCRLLFTQVRQNSMRLVVAIIFLARLLMVISLLELLPVVPPFYISARIIIFLR